MTDIHNLQIIISQSPLLSRYSEMQQHAAMNGAQILNVVEMKKTNRKRSTVNKLTEVEKTEKEEVRKRRMKKSSDQLIDLYG